MPPALDTARVNAATNEWRQGDVVLGAPVEFLHMADLSCPLSPAAAAMAEYLGAQGEPIPDGPQPLTDTAVEGFVVLTQTCDLVRNCSDRPFVEICPLIRASSDLFFEEVLKNNRPSFAVVPGVASQKLVADLDRVMTIEKSLLVGWKRVPGCNSDSDVLDFARALRRRAARFAFPDDFEHAARDMQRRIVSKHHKQSPEGMHLQSLREIRIGASPSWDAAEVQVSFWFIKADDPTDADWVRWVHGWSSLFDQSGRFKLEPPTVARLEDITARDYVETVRLDFDRLSTGQNPAT
jgi:hypothetical protein